MKPIKALALSIALVLAPAAYSADQPLFLGRVHDILSPSLMASRKECEDAKGSFWPSKRAKWADCLDQYQRAITQHIMGSWFSLRSEASDVLIHKMLGDKRDDPPGLARYMRWANKDADILLSLPMPEAYHKALRTYQHDLREFAIVWFDDPQGKHTKEIRALEASASALLKLMPGEHAESLDDDMRPTIENLREMQEVYK